MITLHWTGLLTLLVVTIWVVYIITDYAAGKRAYLLGAKETLEKVNEELDHQIDEAKEDKDSGKRFTKQWSNKNIHP